MDSLTYDQQSTPGMMDALIEMLRMKRQQETQQPVGVGPVASSDVYGEWIRPKAAGSIPMDNNKPSKLPVVENAPIDQIIAALTPGKSDLAMAGMGREVAGFGLAPAASKLDGMPANEPVYQKKGQPAEVVTEQPAEPVALPEIAVSLMAQARDEVAKTPEQKQQLDQALTQKDTDGMSIGQKMATIAMAIAPTLVGYAAHGNKGAYLGAAATGKGLSAGVDEYQQEEKMKQARDIARSRQSVKGSVAEKAGKPGGETEDASGFVFKYDSSGKAQPVMLPNGEQLRRSNAPSLKITPSGQTIPQTKYEGKQQFETAEPSTEGLKTIGDRVKSKESAWASIGRKPSVPEEFSRYQNINPDDPSTPKSLRERYYKWETKDAADLAKAQESDIAAKSRVKEKSAVTDRAGDTRYSQTIKGMVEREYVPLNDLKNRTQPYLDQMNKDLKNVTDPMKWQSFLKTIQQDASVVRPGESEMAMQFMPVSQKIDSWFNRYGKLDSVMTAELGRDINQLFVNLRKIKESNFVDKMNEEKLNAANLGKDRIFEQSMTGDGKTIVKDWAREHLAGSKKMTPVEVAQGMKAGQLKNGDMFYSPQGKPYMIRGIKYDGNTFQQTTPGRAVPWRFQP